MWNHAFRALFVDYVKYSLSHSECLIFRLQYIFSLCTGVIDPGIIAGIAASIVFLCAMLIILLTVTLVVCRRKDHFSEHSKRMKSTYIVETNSDPLLQGGHLSVAPVGVPPVTVPTTDVKSESDQSRDSGQISGQDSLPPVDDEASLFEGDGIMTVPEETTTEAVMDDSTSLGSGVLENFDVEKSESV